MNPVNWWHQHEGGKIAEQRPPPPGADQPYPNLSTVPAKPTPPDAEALQKLTDSLVADRTSAQHAAQSAPLADPSSPSASPSLFGVGTAPPPPPAVAGTPAAAGSTEPPVASASMPAITAPPAPPSAAHPSAVSPSAAPPAAAPRGAVQSAPLQAPASPAVPSGSATANATAGAEQPALPEGPPPRPAGVSAPPPAPVAEAGTMPPASAGPSTMIIFVEQAPSLSAPATNEVKAFAAKRGNNTILVTGYGDAASSDPDSQSAALNLGLSRAQSIADALKSDGVPATAIRVSAEASGRGALLQLLQ